MPRRLARSAGLLVAVVALAVVALPAGPAAPVPSVRGFDGSTLRVGGLGPAAVFPDGDIGARARLARANAQQEIEGITVEYTSYADDGQTAETALAAAQRLVQEDRVFAVVPNLSQLTPTDELTRRRVPWFGWGFDPSYCSASAKFPVFGFGYSGCLAPGDARRVADTGRQLFEYVSAKTPGRTPTLAVFSTTNDAARSYVAAQASSFASAGFDVVFAKALLPTPLPADLSPYVEALLTAHQGVSPDAIVCLATTDCLPTWQLLRANNYAGTFQSGLYADFFVGAMAGSVANPQYVPLDAATDAQARMVEDVRAVKADALITPAVVASYLSADMFVASLRQVVADDADVTPVELQRAAAAMTFEVKGLFGPTRYPDAFVAPSPACSALVLANGTAWETVAPFRCAKKTFPFDARFTGT